MILLAFIVIFLLVDIVEHLDHIMDSDISRMKILLYFIYTIPWYSSLGLPMALLLATVFTMGALQKNNELCAIKAAGISIKRISISLLTLGILFSVLSFYYDNIIVTHYLQKKSILGEKYNLTRFKKNNLNQKNIFRQESKEKILGIQKFLFRENVAHKVSLQSFEDGNLIDRLDIPLMKWDENNKLWEFSTFHLRKWKNDSLIYNSGNNDTTFFLNFDPIELTKKSVNPEEMNYWELKQFVQKLNQYGINDPKWSVNMHFKTAFACTSFLMILFGLSLSIRKPRSNLAVGVGVGLFVIFIYYAAITTGRSLGYKGTIEPFLSVWLTNLFFFIIGIYLFQKTKT